MYKPTTLRVAAIMAMLLSVLGLLVSLFLARHSGMFLLGVLSWAFLLWASYLGYQLAGYQLYPAEYKKVGIRIYLIIAAFGLFMVVGIVVGLGLSVVLLATLWGLKRNYDDWVPSAEPETEEAGGAA